MSEATTLDDFDSLRKLLNLKLSGPVLFACRLLASRGFRFCVDFGYQNAIEKAVDLDCAEGER